MTAPSAPVRWSLVYRDVHAPDARPVGAARQVLDHAGSVVCESVSGGSATGTRRTAGAGRARVDKPRGLSLPSGLPSRIERRAPRQRGIGAAVRASRLNPILGRDEGSVAGLTRNSHARR